MKSRFYKLTAFCLIAVMLAAVFNGCGTAKPEAAKPTVQTTEATTESTAAEQLPTETAAPAETPEQKAMLLYAELLQSKPTILNQDTEILGDRSFGYDENVAKYGEHYDNFVVLDLNNDGIPELITYTIINISWVPVSVFQYQESENALRLLKDPLDPESHATFECMSTAGGMYGLYICRENHLHSIWGGDTPIGYQEENHAYVLTNEGLVSVDCAISSNTTADDADIVLNIWDVEKINDEEARNSVFNQ